MNYKSQMDAYFSTAYRKWPVAPKPKEYEMTFNSNLFASLASRHGVIVEMSKAIGICQDSLCDYRGGMCKPNKENAEKIAKYFGKTYEDMLIPVWEDYE